MPKKPLRIAAIDIGTNSIHMIVVEGTSGEYRLLDREKDMAQLGLASLDGQPLTEAAMERSVTALTRMAEVAKKWEVDEVIAVATSAVREAPNRAEFLKRVESASGIKVRVISGEEEADFIFHAVRSSVEIGNQTALSIDLGGGSAELIVGTAAETFFTRSEPLGALRMAQRFNLAGRADEAAIEQCRRFVIDRLRSFQRKVHHLGIDLCVGTSGTVQALATIAAGGAAETTGALRVLERSTLEELIPKLAELDSAERAKKFQIDEKRAISIVAGAVVIHAMMTAFKVDSLLACTAAMREGIILKRLADEKREARRGKSVRYQSVLALAKRTNCDLKHGAHVAKLAARIFDQTTALHRCSDEGRQLLEYAALLHETGKHVSDRGHHKHSYYLVRHSDLKGFTHEQLVLVANLARYYRKAEPDAEHPNFAELSEGQRDVVMKLGAILRIAEALDRGHQQRVRDIGVRAKNGRVNFIVRTRSDASVEIRSAAKRARYFKDVFRSTVRFEVA